MKEIQHKTKRTLMESNVPNMVELQLESYNWFLSKGIKELFRSFSPIKDHQESNKYSLELLDYELGKPKFTEEECRYRDNSTYERPIRIKCQLVVKDESGAIKEIIPETLYFGELPIMTDKGTFVINGAERVVVSQLTRSPGAYFEDNIDISGTMLYTGRIIPGNGCWLEVETDARGIMQAKLAQSDKFPLTVLLRAFSAISEACPVYLPSLIGKELPKDITNPVTGEPVFSCRKKNGKPAVFTKADYKRVKDLLTGLYKDENYRFREYVLSPDYIYDKELGQTTSTTLDILNIFGEKTFVPVERTFKCESFYHYADYNENGEPVVNPKTGEVIRDPYVVVPSKDPDPKTDKMLRVFKKDLYKFDPRGEKLIRIQGKYIKDADLEQIKADSVKETRRNFSEYSIEGMRPVKTVCARGGEDNPEIVLAEPEAYWPKVRDLIADDADNPGIRTIEDAVRKIEADENVEILCLAGEMIDRDTAQKIFEIGAGFLEVYKLDPFISETLKCEQHRNYADYNAGARTHEILDAEEAIRNFYIYMNSNKSIVEDRESSRAYLRNYIFDNRRYDLGAVGRYKINKKLLLDLPEFSNNNLEPIRSITRDDLIQLIKYIISLNQDGVIVYSFDAEKRDKALETVDEYIAKEEAATKQREVAKKLPGSRLGKLVRFRKMFAECRKGYMFSSADYAEFIDIASGIRFNISEDGSFVLDPEGSRRLDAIISNSPETLTELCAVKVKNCVTDEIDHLENKRVRSVGELLQDQLRGGFNKLQKVCQEKMGHPNTQNAANPKNQEKVTPGYLITNKPITSAIRSFFG
ncbi:MAG: hypothetical protein ILO36_09330, partial [Abditibacteriota bacterium]|nr:hypothetical protein [Abditibacteriota bacterium]